jgi:hypothetical protein
MYVGTIIVGAYELLSVAQCLRLAATNLAVCI